MASKGTWNWNYLRMGSAPEAPAPSSNNASKPTPSSGRSSSPRRSTESKLKTQRMKSASQVRRVIKPTPPPQLSLSNRAAVMLSLSKEALLALRYLPTGILSIPGNWNQDTSNSLQHSFVGKHGGFEPKRTAQDGVYYSSAGSGTGQSQNGPTDQVITPVPIKMTQTYPDGSRHNLSSSSATNPASIFSISKLSQYFEGTLFKKQQKILSNITRDVDLNRQHLEARTRYLVSSINKNVMAENPINLLNLLDTLFQHTYQNIDTREIAVDSGAVKILTKISKMYESDLNILNRTRELLALLGYNPPVKGNGIKILAIDGGGVRGLLAIEILRVIEAQTGKKIYELFDFICGVSTGSILAFLIGAYRRSLDECEGLYKELSKDIFSQSSIMGAGSLVWSHAYYNTAGWEKILKKNLGDTKLISLAKDLDLPRVAAISTVVSNERITPYVFRTYAFPTDVTPKYRGGCRYEMWEAVRASAAAPTYFEEIKLGNHLHQDGGVLVNNPSSIALTEAKTIWKDTPLQCVVSIGTGLTLTSLTQEAVGDQFCGGSNVQDGEATVKPPNSLSWKGKLLKVLDSATDTEAIHYTLRELLPPEVYFRLNPYLTEVIGLDESDPAKLQKAQAEAKAYVEKNVIKVGAMKKALLKGKGVTKMVTDWWKY